MGEVLNRKQFVLDSNVMKIKEILNRDFLKIEILAIAEGNNCNETSFTLKSMQNSLPTFYNKFILGYFNVQGDVNNEGHFEEHNSDLKYDSECDEMYYSYLAPNAERPLGMIRESDTVEIVNIEGKNWIRLTAVILTKYNREAVKHLLKRKAKNKISVEITINKWHKENGIDIIEDFTLDGITILGTRKNSNKVCEEGIKGASMILKFLKSESFNAQRKVLNFAYQELDSMGENEHQEEITMKNNQTKNKEVKKERGNLAMENENKNLEVTEQFSEEVVTETEQATEVAEENVYTENSEEPIVEFASAEDNASEGTENFAEKDKEDSCEEPCEKEENNCQGFTEESEIDCIEAKEAKDVNGEIFDCDCEEKDDDDIEEEIHEEHSECQEVCASEETCPEEIEEAKEEKECDNFSFENIAFSLEDENGESHSFSCENTSEAIINTVSTYFQDRIDNISIAYKELEERYAILEKEQNKAKYIACGKELFEAEEALTEADKNSIQEIYNEKCEKNEFSSVEEAKEYISTQIAKKFYENAKAQKRFEKREFSAKIKENNNSIEKESKDSMKEMKKLLDM